MPAVIGILEKMGVGTGTSTAWSCTGVDYISVNYSGPGKYLSINNTNRTKAFLQTPWDLGSSLVLKVLNKFDNHILRSPLNVIKVIANYDLRRLEILKNFN